MAAKQGGVTVLDKKDACLKAHNALRALHADTSPLQWDKDLQKEAEAWAKHLAETDTFAHCKERNGAGENIFCGMAKDPASVSKAILSWYSEHEKYNYSSTEICRGTGHFTQVVWKNSTKLGVGVAVLDKGPHQKTFVVARYKPPGNFGMQPEYTKNVAKRRDKAEVPTLEELEKVAGK